MDTPYIDELSPSPPSMPPVSCLQPTQTPDPMASNLNPALMPRLENYEPSSSENELQPSEMDSELLFYRLKNHRRQKVCPFSDPTRPNPCTSHSTPRSCKDLIMHHLKKVKDSGGDSTHPLDDPLWNSLAVNWFLLPRPPRLSEDKRKAATKSAQHRYYKKRKVKQANHAEPMKKLLEENQITEDQYTSFLIGDKRRAFITERKVRARIENDLRNESERRLCGEIEKKLSELRSQGGLGNSGESIVSLEAARNDLEQTRATVDAYKSVLSDQASNVVNFWTNEQFLATEMTVLQYHGFQWPQQVSEASFYLFATLLVPMSKWDGQIRSESSIRHMQQAMRRFVTAEKDNVSAEDGIVLDQTLQTFTGCCTTIKESEERMASMTEGGAQAWLDAQDSYWNEAKAAFRNRFQFDSRPPIELVRLIDDFADTWRAQKNAETANETAQEAVNNLL